MMYLKELIEKNGHSNILIVSGCEWADIYGTKDDLKNQLKELVEKIK